jgi:hypothetical protein
MAMTPSELVQDVCPKIAAHGWAYYFVPETVARGEQLGLDVFGFYFLGRGGVLGDVEWPVVHSAFGYFNPDVVRDSWNAGRDKVAPRDAGRAYIECCHGLGRRRLADVDGLEAFCKAAEQVNDAAEVPGLSLYAAISAEPLATDPPARAMQLVAVLRELRGSAHLLAVVASGLGAREAHYLHLPDFWGMFGWSDSDIPEVTDHHRSRLEAAEVLTDSLVLPAYSVLDAEGAEALVSGINAIADVLTA